MKIYRVVYTETGNTRSVWQSYRSASGSAAQARGDVRVEVAHVPDDAWKPVDKGEESRLARLENLWHGLTVEDARDALRSLEEHLQRRIHWQQRTAPVSVLGQDARDEAEAILTLNRLADTR